jgi:hypothetical protein
LLVQLDLGFQQRQLFGQLAYVTHVLKHDLAKNRYDLAIFFDRDALDNHILASNSVGLVDFGFAGLCNDVHPGVFNDLGAVLPYLGSRVDTEKLAVRGIEMSDISLGVCNHYTVINAVQNKVEQLQLIAWPRSLW